MKNIISWTYKSKTNKRKQTEAALNEASIHCYFIIKIDIDKKKERNKTII